MADYQIDDLILNPARIAQIGLTDQWVRETGGPARADFAAADMDGYRNALREFGQSRDPAMGQMDNALRQASASSERLRRMAALTNSGRTQFADGFSQPENSDRTASYQAFFQALGDAASAHTRNLQNVVTAANAVPEGHPYQQQSQFWGRFANKSLSQMPAVESSIRRGRNLVDAVVALDRVQRAELKQAELGELVGMVNTQIKQQNQLAEEYKQQEARNQFLKDVAPPAIGRPMSNEEWRQGTERSSLKPRSKELRDLDDKLKNCNKSWEVYDKLSDQHQSKLDNYMKTAWNNPGDVGTRKEFYQLRTNLKTALQDFSKNSAALDASLESYNRAKGYQSNRDKSGTLTQMKKELAGRAEAISEGQRQFDRGDGRIYEIEENARFRSAQQSSARAAASEEAALKNARSSRFLEGYVQNLPQGLERSYQQEGPARESVAASDLTRASNIIQVAYIPGVTGRGEFTEITGTPTSAVPGPSADRESRSVSEYSSTHSDDLYSSPPPRGPGHRTLPSDVTAATLDVGARASMLPPGAAAQEPQAPRPSSSIYSQSIRDSQVERASQRESIASNYPEEAISSPLPAQTIVRGRARPVVIGSEQQQPGSSQQPAVPSPSAQPGPVTLPSTTFTPQQRRPRQPGAPSVAEGSQTQRRQSREESPSSEERSRSPSPQAQQRATRDGQRRDTQLPSRGPSQGHKR